MHLTKAVNNISESDMLNSSKPIKFAYLQKLVNELILHVIEMGQTFLKAKISLAVWWKLKRVNLKKKSENDSDIYLLKFLLSGLG